MMSLIVLKKGESAFYNGKFLNSTSIYPSALCAALSIKESKSLKDFTCIDVKYFIKEWLKLYLYLSNLLNDKLLSF